MTVSDIRPISVGELADHPPFRLEVLAGVAGLEREVQWVHVIDVRDPGGWLTAGELVMTSGTGLPREANGQVMYLRQLADAEAAGLVVSRGSLAAPLTAAALAEAEAAQLPVLAIPYEVSFSAVTRFVAGAQVRSARDVLELIHSVHEAALALGETSPTAQETITRIGAALRADVALISLARRSVTVDSSGELAAHVDELCEAHAAHGGHLPAVLRLAERLAVVPVPSPEATALIARGWHERPPLAALQHAAVTVAIALQAEAAEARIERDRLSVLLNAFVAGTAPVTELVGRLADLGLDVGPWSVASLDASGVERVIRLVAERDVVAARFGVRHGSAVLLVREDPQTVAALRAAAAEIAPIGLSAVLHDLDELRDAVAEAELARRAAGDDTAPMRRYGEDHWSPLAPNSQAAAREYVERTIGELVAQSQSRPWLLETLRTYLECDRSPSRTATALGIHRQTLVSRIRRIETTLGHSLASTAVLARIWPALCLLDDRHDLPTK